MLETETVTGMEFRSLNDKIKRIMRRSAGDSVRLGYLLSRMMEERLWDGQYNCFDEYLKTELHMDYTMANRFIGINKKYSVDGRSADIDTKWADYSQAVLIEMLSMPPELEGQITPDMSVRQVREVKRQARKKSGKAKRKTQKKADGAEREAILAEQEAIQTERGTEMLGAGNAPIQDVDTFPGQVGVEEWLASMPKELPVCGQENTQDPAKSFEELPGKEEVLVVEYRELESEEDIATSQPKGTEAAGETAESYPLENDQKEPDEDMSEITDETAEVRRILNREQKTLDDYLAAGGLPEKAVFRQKTIVAALAAMVCDLENGGQDAQEQPPLPVLKNNTQRKEWLGTYKSWGLWYRDEHIGVDYYKYDFANGARLIA